MAKQAKVVTIDPAQYPIAEGFPRDMVILTGTNRGKLFMGVNNVAGVVYDEAGNMYPEETCRPLTKEEFNQVYKSVPIF